jgi:hypothetical protein
MTCVSSGLFVFGIAVLSFGLYVRVGGCRLWYLLRGTTVIMPGAVRNAPIPLGMTCIVWGIVWCDLIPDAETRSRLFGYVVMPMLVASIVLGGWNPRWLQPQWLAYLNNMYGKIMTRRLLGEGLKDYR